MKTPVDMEPEAIQFSVIIPCYNVEKTIIRALDSLVLQEYSNWEVICVDDSSKDNTISVINDYKSNHLDKRITLLCNEQNMGPGCSRNQALKIAKGEYFCFLDADDYYEDLLFKSIDETIKETNADIIFYGFRQIIGNTIRNRKISARKSIPDYLALVGGSFGGGVWRRSLWKDIEIPALSNAEDIAVIPVLISRAKIIITIDKQLYNYVHSNNSISSCHQPIVCRNFADSFNYTLEHLDFHKYHSSVEFHGIKTIIYGATLNAIKAGMKNEDIIDLWLNFEQRFPNWIDNCYLNYYARSKRFFVWLAARRCFTIMRCYAFIHSLLLKTLGKR